MALKGSDRVVVIQSIEANRWEILWHRVDNIVNVAGSSTMTIQVSAMFQDANGVITSSVALPQITYSGNTLAAMLTEAGLLYTLYKAGGADEKTAYYLATRDTLYNQLKSDGIIPSDAH